MAYTPDFEIAHIGVNCADAAQAERCAEQFAVLFQLAVNPAKESADARFTGTQIEWMKAPGRGEHGHIALATGKRPCHAAAAFCLGPLGLSAAGSQAQQGEDSQQNCKKSFHKSSFLLWSDDMKCITSRPERKDCY